MTSPEAVEGRPEHVMPTGLSDRAQSFWRAIDSDFELTDAEAQLLLETTQTITEIDQLKSALDEQGVTVTGSMGQSRVHPAVNEIRQHRMALARLLKQLDLGDEQPETEATKAARAAANARWSMSRARDSSRVAPGVAADSIDIRDRARRG